MTIAKKTRRKRKSKALPPVLRYRGRKKNPAVAAAQKALWADPEYRARQLAARAIAGEKRRGRAMRVGIPSGMRRAQAEPLNIAAAESARNTMTELKKTDALEGLDPRGEEALETSLTLMRAPGDKKLRLAAAGLVLKYTKAPPATAQKITINKAEEWLAQVAGTNADDEGETATDA